MSTQHKAYRFRLRPTARQEAAMLRQAGACRFVWNWALGRRKEHFAATSKTLGWVAQSRELTELKRREGMEWLSEVARQCLTASLRDLDRAFANFFAKRARYPRFKARKRCLPAFRCPQDVRLVGDHVTVPKVGQVRVRGARPIEGKPKSASFKRDASGRWFVAIIAEFEMPDVALPPVDPARVVGIDLGLKEFAVLSTGERIASPKFFAQGQRKLRKAQRALARCQPGSNRRAKAKVRIARVHARTADQRGDFLHKLSTRLAAEHGGLCLEDLSLKGLVKTKLAKSFADASMGEFRRLVTYKSIWNRKPLAVVDRWFPSSRLCRGCGFINDRLSLQDRSWTCPCGMVHDRDLSAAINIRDEGLRRLAAGHAESLNARGVHVRPAKAGSGR